MDRWQRWIEMHDKLAALDKLARALGMYANNLDVT
jgi:hypothetical protein